MKRLEIKCWCIWFVALSLLLFASSCKSRDVSKSKKSEQIELSSQTNQSEIATDKSQEKNQTSQEKESAKSTKEEAKKTAYKLTPVDKDKPIIIKDSDGNETSISNAVVESENSETTTQTEEKSKESKTSEASKQNDIVKNSTSSSNTSFKAKAEALAKESKSEPISILSFWWVAVIAIIAWFIYKKIKNYGWKNSL